MHTDGFEMSELQLIYSHLIDRTQTVKVKGERSTEHQIKSGVPQGSLLGVLLFNIYLRTTVPLVSYIRNSIRLGIMLPLVPVVKILKKIGVTGKIWEKAGVKLFRDLTEKSVNFSTLATSNIRFLLVFGEEDQ